MIPFLRRKDKSKIRVAFNVSPIPTSWGGQNQFVDLFAAYLKAKGYEIVYQLDPGVTHILLLSVYDYETVTFLPDAVKKFRRKHPNVRVLHRINDCDVRKRTANVDPAMVSANTLANHTVYISDWLREYFIGKGISSDNSCEVIHNAVTDEVFYPGPELEDDTTFRLVTHHWSDNWMKGFREYFKIDQLIASGELSDVQLTVIGKWPSEIKWKTARTIAPCNGVELATHLRKHHLYVTASRWEPGGMHFIEGIQCGLPVIFHREGGGINELAEKYGYGFTDNLKETVLLARENFASLRQKVLTDETRPSGLRMCKLYEKALLNG